VQRAVAETQAEQMVVAFADDATPVVEGDELGLLHG
jgi:hypothetical protein